MYHNIVNNIMMQVLKPENLDSLLDYLRQKATDIKIKTKNKYLVILYGPPGSGKKLARKIVCQYMKKWFGETVSLLDIYNSFLDVGVDDITYEVKLNDKTILELLQENIKKYIDTNKDINIEEQVDQNIEQLTQSSYEIYKTGRETSNKASDLLRYLALYLGHNIFFEISTPDVKYIDRMVKDFRYYDYIPIVIYPYINKIQTLYERSINRGIKEGRFITCHGEHGIIKKAKDCFDSYDNIINKIKQLNRISNQYATIMYHANFSKEIYDRMNEFNFNEFNTVISYEYDNGIVQMKEINHSFINKILLDC